MDCAVPCSVCSFCGEQLNHQHYERSPACWQACLKLNGIDLSGSDDLKKDNISAGARAVHDEEIRKMVSKFLCDCRAKYVIQGEQMNAVKTFIDALANKVARVTYQRLAAHLSSVPCPEVVEDILHPHVLDGLATQAQEVAYAGKSKPVLEPRKVELSPGHHVGSFDLAQLIERKLLFDPKARRQCEEVSDKLKSGEWHEVMPSTVGDVLQGARVRFDPDLCRKATDDEIDDFRMPLMMQADDVEVRAGPLARCWRRASPASSPRTHTRARN